MGLRQTKLPALLYSNRQMKSYTSLSWPLEDNVALKANLLGTSLPGHGDLTENAGTPTVQYVSSGGPDVFFSQPMHMLDGVAMI